MLLADVVEVSERVASTRSRLAKREAIAGLLRSADAGDLAIAVPYLSGELRQRRTGVGWASLRDVPAPAAEPSLSLQEVDRCFAELADLSGTGSAGRRTAAVTALFGRATAAEQSFLRGLISGDLRQGALDAAMVDAVAEASGVPVDAVRRAVMFCGSTAPVALAALTEGDSAVEQFRLTVGRPVRPMLAASAPDIASALDAVGSATASLDIKLDGIRIQVHKSGDEVRVFTRSLDEITERLPEVVAVAGSLPVQTVVLDGEAMTLDESGKPRPFQETASRTARRLLAESDMADADAGAEGGTVTPFFFDCLYVDGADLVDLPLRERLGHLDRVVPGEFRVPRTRTADVEVAQRFFDEAVAAGQEGVVAKSLEATYDAGRRGSGWVKVKPRHTLDLVVLAVEWGSGRRQGWLSNIHLGARDPDTDGFVMLGKTFKGMTDEMLQWQTKRFLELEASRSGHVVHLRPEQVVEIAFDGLQRSTRYPGGLALRFARVIRYRDDKLPAEADTINTVRILA